LSHRTPPPITPPLQYSTTPNEIKLGMPISYKEKRERFYNQISHVFNREQAASLISLQIAQKGKKSTNMRITFLILREKSCPNYSQGE
jgi:hypothetical protein